MTNSVVHLRYFFNIQEHLQALEYIMVHLYINFYLP